MTRLAHFLFLGLSSCAALAACAKAENSVGSSDAGTFVDSSTDGTTDASGDALSTGGASGSGGVAGSGGIAGAAGASGAGGQTDASSDVDVGDAQGDGSTTTGLQGFWRFEEATGPVVDSSGNGLTGQVKGSGVTRGGAGKSGNGNAISFSGGDGQVQIPSNPKLNFTTGATIQFWIQLSSVTQGTILARGTGSGDTHVRIKTTQGNINVSMGTSTPATLISSPNVIGSTWTHVTVVNDNASLKLYINGKLETSATGGGMSSLLTDLYFGKSAAADTAISGNLDEVRWLNVARTDQEICADAGGTWGATEAGTGCL